MSSRRNTQHCSRHGRSVSGDNPPRMKPLIEGQNVDEEGAPETEDLRENGRMKKMTRRYSLNEEKLRCMRQTSFEAINDDEMPQLGRVRTRRWSTSWRIPMGKSQRKPFQSFVFFWLFLHRKKSQRTSPWHLLNTKYRRFGLRGSHETLWFGPDCYGFWQKKSIFATKELKYSTIITTEAEDCSTHERLFWKEKNW